jgi:hypothetical protein
VPDPQLRSFTVGTQSEAEIVALVRHLLTAGPSEPAGAAQR